jgi:hypothetical protein
MNSAYGPSGSQGDPTPGQLVKVVVNGNPG